MAENNNGVINFDESSNVNSTLNDIKNTNNEVSPNSTNSDINVDDIFGIANENISNGEVQPINNNYDDSSINNTLNSEQPINIEDVFGSQDFGSTESNLENGNESTKFDNNELASIAMNSLSGITDNGEITLAENTNNEVNNDFSPNANSSQTETNSLVKEKQPILEEVVPSDGNQEIPVADNNSSVANLDVDVSKTLEQTLNDKEEIVQINSDLKENVESSEVDKSLISDDNQINAFANPFNNQDTTNPVNINDTNNESDVQKNGEEISSVSEDTSIGSVSEAQNGSVLGQPEEFSEGLPQSNGAVNQLEVNNIQTETDANFPQNNTGTGALSEQSESDFTINNIQPASSDNVKINSNDINSTNDENASDNSGTVFNPDNNFQVNNNVDTNQTDSINPLNSESNSVNLEVNQGTNDSSSNIVANQETPNLQQALSMPQPDLQSANNAIDNNVKLDNSVNVGSMPVSSTVPAIEENTNVNKTEEEKKKGKVNLPIVMLILIIVVSVGVIILKRDAILDFFQALMKK